MELVTGRATYRAPLEDPQELMEKPLSQHALRLRNLYILSTNAYVQAGVARGTATIHMLACSLTSCSRIPQPR